MQAGLHWSLRNPSNGTVVDGWLKDPNEAQRLAGKYSIPTDDLKYYDCVMFLVDTAFEAEASKNKGKCD